MNAPVKPAPWAELTADQKRALVIPLIADGQSYSQVASAVGAPSRSAIAQVIYNTRQSGHEMPRAISVAASCRKNVRGGKPNLNAIKAHRTKSQANPEEAGSRGDARSAPAVDAGSRPASGRSDAAKSEIMDLTVVGAESGTLTPSTGLLRYNNFRPHNIANKAESRKNDPGLSVTVTAAAVWDPIDGIEPVRVVDHREGMCRWPIDVDADTPDFHFCGAPRDDRSPYCRCHRILSLPEHLRNQEVA